METENAELDKCGVCGVDAEYGLCTTCLKKYSKQIFAKLFDESDV